MRRPVSNGEFALIVFNAPDTLTNHYAFGLAYGSGGIWYMVGAVTLSRAPAGNVLHVNPGSSVNDGGIALAIPCGLTAKAAFDTTASVATNITDAVNAQPHPQNQAPAQTIQRGYFLAQQYVLANYTTVSSGVDLSNRSLDLQIISVNPP
jgi:hypothetical protein